jgi:uncharacterized membrane protein YhaH (DUF805 family)
MFKQPFSFDGRIRRTEYCLSILIYGFGAGIIGVGLAGSPVVALFYIPAIWFYWAQSAKRCHDRGNSGWWQLIPFYALWLMFADGEPGVNEYGPNPKEVGATYNNNYNNYNNYNNVNSNNGGYSNNNEYKGGYNGGHNAGGQHMQQNQAPQNQIPQNQAPHKQGGEYNSGDLYK